MINSISIKNFKSIKFSPVFPLGSWSALVGENAAGKTNLVQAIMFVVDLSLGLTTSEVQKKISLTPGELFYFNESTKEFYIDFFLETPEDEKYSFSLRISLQNGTMNPPKLLINSEELKKVSPENQIIYSRDKENVNVPNREPNNLSIPADKLAMPNLALLKIQEIEEVNSILSGIAIIEDVQIYEGRSSKGTTEPTANDIASLVYRLNHTFPDRYKEFLSIVKKLLPHFSNFFELKPPGSANESPQDVSYLILLGEENLKDKLSMLSVSGGDLRTVYIIAKALSMNDNSTLIIEEIENGLHPKRLSGLLERLKRIIFVKNMQLIFTTHSVTIFDDLSTNEIIYTGKDKNNGTFFKPLEQEEERLRIKDYLKKGGRISDVLLSGKLF